MATGITRKGGTFVTTLRSRKVSVDSIYEECGLWLKEAAEDIRDMAKYLVSGVLLKKVTGRLANSIYSRQSHLYAEVGTANEEGVIWEVYGVRGPIRVTGAKQASFLKLLGAGSKSEVSSARHRAILIQKGASMKGAQGSQTRFRQATYTRITYKPPVRWLSKATELQMLGPTGHDRLRVLGVNVGRIAAWSIIEQIRTENAGGSVIVRGLT